MKWTELDTSGKISFSSLLLSIISIIASVVLTILALNLQSRMSDFDVDSRAIENQPVININGLPVASDTKYPEDTNWIYKRYSRRSSFKPSEFKTNIECELINNSEHRAQLLGYIAIDFPSDKQIKISKYLLNPGRVPIIHTDKIILLGEGNSQKISVPGYEPALRQDSTFYLHLIVFYTNQYKDYFQSYFILKGLIHGEAGMGDNSFVAEGIKRKPKFITFHAVKSHSNYVKSNIRETYEDLFQNINDAMETSE